MIKNPTFEKLMKFLIVLLGAGLGIGAAMLALPFLRSSYPKLVQNLPSMALMFTGAGILGAAIGFVCAKPSIRWVLQMTSEAEHMTEKMPMQQISLCAMGLIAGLVVAALITQLILSAGASLITISFSALMYVTLGFMGVRIGYRRFKNRRAESAAEERHPARKFLDTSVIIDGRVLDILKTGFLEGEIVVPQFVLAELRHIADSSDAQRRMRGRRGLDVLGDMQKQFAITVEETDYADLTEVDVKLLRLAKEQGGTVVTNDYNLNKVAGVSGIRVLNINDLSNAVKPMLMAGEEMTVQIVREGKEPGQGVAYLDDGTMVVVENGRRFLGETIAVVVTTVLQTSAGRMIFTKAADTAVKTGA